MEREILGLTIGIITIVALITPVIGVLLAETPPPSNEPLNTTTPEEPSRDMPVFEFKGGWGRLKTGFLLNTSFEDVLKLAYTIRNITYPLYEWEIKYNTTVANVSLRLGDKFLEKALNISSEHPRTAMVYAFVAAIHYAHAPAYANPVLGRVIRINLGENNTITNNTVVAVIDTSKELRSILVGAIDYASSKGYNTTIPEKIMTWADERLDNATKELESGNITRAFHLAVSAYHGYVRSYSALVKIVFADFTKSLVENITSTLVEQRTPISKRVLDVLPVGIREMVKEKLEAGEYKTIKDIVGHVKNETKRTMEQIWEREKEQLKIAIKNKIGEIKKKSPRVSIGDQDIESIIEQYYSKGYRGLDLAKAVIREIEERLSAFGFKTPLFPGLRH
jgi:hypothetical protein